MPKPVSQPETGWGIQCQLDWTGVRLHGGSFLPCGALKKHCKFFTRYLVELSLSIDNSIRVPADL